MIDIRWKVFGNESHYSIGVYHPKYGWCNEDINFSYRIEYISIHENKTIVEFQSDKFYAIFREANFDTKECWEVGLISERKEKGDEYSGMEFGHTFFGAFNSQIKNAFKPKKV
jgi:hypothetical protein